MSLEPSSAPRGAESNPGPERLTPMFLQWREAKRAHPGAVLFFRMGDFYELFFEDALLAAPLLDLALTARGKGTATEAPMCGVPHFAVEGYVAKLIERGLKVAICEQVEDPKKTKGMVRREVVRVLSPGVYADERLPPGQPVWLAAVSGSGPFGLCFVDLSTGALRLATAGSLAEVRDALQRYEARELVFAESRAAVAASWIQGLEPAPALSPVPDERFHPIYAAERLLEAIGAHSFSGFACDENHPAIPSAAAALSYLHETQKTRPRHLDRLSVDEPGSRLLIDPGTRRNLELTSNLRDGSTRFTLLELLDRTSTPLGARLLRAWLLEPLTSVPEIVARHDAVAALHGDTMARRQLGEQLEQIRDLERLLSRCALGSATPRDLLALRGSLRALPGVRADLSKLVADRLRQLAERVDPLSELEATLQAQLADEPALQPGDGRVLKEGFDAALDEARDLARGGKRVLAEIEARERERTGIASLKIKYNKVFGYYIEITKSQLERVPADYERRQTVVGGERYVTPELRELESRILSAEERLGERERELFGTLVQRVVQDATRLRSTAGAIAEIDLLASLADVAARDRFVRPLVDDQDRSEIDAGRHPVIARLLPAETFVPNSSRLDGEQRIVIVTGPNMGGKSTYLRQVALIQLMAQIGSFVPARAAKLGVVDRIFCRVGASDNLAGGESTFMVEMTETAQILHSATPRSLVILDEIGRGTATWDGMAIAWSVVEALHDDPRLQPKALFATHYHELTELAGQLPRLANVQIAVREEGHDIVFLHRIDPGPSDRSYGIHVARLAGLPDRVVGRAREILARWISQHATASTKTQSPPVQLSIFNDPLPQLPAAERELLDALRELDPDRLSPKEALLKLYEWKDRLRSS